MGLEIPRFVTEEELDAGLSVFEAIAPDERPILCRAMRNSKWEYMGFRLMSAALLRHLERKLELSRREVLALIAEKRTVVGLVFE